MINKVNNGMKIFNINEVITGLDGNSHPINRISKPWGTIEYFYDKIHCFRNNLIDFDKTLQQMNCIGIMQHQQTGQVVKISSLDSVTNEWELVYLRNDVNDIIKKAWESFEKTLEECRKLLERPIFQELKVITPSDYHCNWKIVEPLTTEDFIDKVLEYRMRGE